MKIIRIKIFVSLQIHILQCHWTHSFDSECDLSNCQTLCNLYKKPLCAGADAGRVIVLLLKQTTHKSS